MRILQRMPAWCWLLIAWVTCRPGATAQGVPTLARIEASLPQSNGRVLAAERETLTLYAIHDGSDATFQWRRNGVVIAAGSRDSLSWNEVVAADAGTYTVVVTAGGKSITSPGLALEVVAGLVIAPGSPRSVRTGTPVSWTVSYAGAGTLNQISWWHDGSPVPGATQATLSIPKVSFDDAGHYSVRALHPLLGRMVSSPTLELQVYADLSPARIMVQPQDQGGRPGGTAVFSVGVVGTPPFQYQWQKEGVDLSGATNFHLALRTLASGNAGTYRCRVKGLVGAEVISTSASLTVSAAPPANAVADSLVSSARAALALRKSSAVSAATVTLATALGIQPTHEQGLVLHSLARLMDRANTAEFNRFLDRVGFDPVGRDLFHWSSHLPRDADDRLIAPVGVNASEIPRFARTNLVSEMDEAIKSLMQVRRSDFVLPLTASETGSSAVAVDSGDLAWFRSLLHLAGYLVRTLNAWNLSSRLTDLSDLDLSGSLDVETLLRTHPDLLTLDSAEQVAAARKSLEAAVDAYVQGAALVRTRAQGENHLFNVDPPQLDDEAHFRQFLLDLKASLGEVVTLNEHPEYQFSLARLVDTQAGPRSFLPAFSTNAPDPSSWPAESFASAVRSQGAPQIVFQPVARSPYVVGVHAIGQAPLRYQWYRNGVAVPGATNALLEINSALGAGPVTMEVGVANALGSARSRPVTLTVVGDRLLWGASVSPEKLVGLSLKGAGGTRLRIETSVDCRTWTPVLTNELPASGTLMFLPFQAGQPRQFYRAVAGP